MSRATVDQILKQVFYNVSESELKKHPNRVHRHNMTVMETEILGQFLDTFTVSEEDLKRILAVGLLYKCCAVVQLKHIGHMVSQVNHSYSPFDDSDEVLLYCSECGARCKKEFAVCPMCEAEFDGKVIPLGGQK